MPGYFGKHKRRDEPERPECPTCHIQFTPNERHCMSPTCDIWICEDDDTVYESGRDLVRPTRPRN